MLFLKDVVALKIMGWGGRNCDTFFIYRINMQQYTHCA